MDPTSRFKLTWVGNTYDGSSFVDQFKIKWVKSQDKCDYRISCDAQQITIKNPNNTIIYSGFRKHLKPNEKYTQYDDLRYMYENCNSYYESSSPGYGSNSYKIALLNDGRVMVVVVSSSGLVNLHGAFFNPVDL